MNISIDFHGVKLYNIGEKRNFSPIYFSVPGGDIVVYIVSDERIAVENFEQGKIYKVDFVDETVLYGVCVGIGSEFVMLSGDISGYIFPLTMQTASQVSSIELYDPTPPEPPVPWTNLLQYQTGVPPFEFPTTDTSLFSWYIEGEGVGDKTANLWSEDYTGISTSMTYKPLYVGDGNFTLSTTTPYELQVANIFLLSGNVSSGATTIGNGAWLNHNVTTVAENGYITIAYRHYNNTTSPAECKTMINTGSTAIPYEPYGYKIPILCNDNLTNIYLDAPLSEGEILYSTDIDTAIVTDIGDNELTVETTQQPTAMQIVYKIADR